MIKTSILKLLSLKFLKGVEDESGTVSLLYDYLRDNDYSKVVDLDSQDGQGYFELQRFFCRQDPIVNKRRGVTIHKKKKKGRNNYNTIKAKLRKNKTTRTLVTISRLMPDIVIAETTLE